MLNHPYVEMHLSLSSYFNHFTVLLNSVCKHFVVGFHIYVHQWYWTAIFFLYLCMILPGLDILGDAGLIKWFQKHCFLSNIFRTVWENKDGNIFSKCLPRYLLIFVAGTLWLFSFNFIVGNFHILIHILLFLLSLLLSLFSSFLHLTFSLSFLPCSVYILWCMGLSTLFIFFIVYSHRTSDQVWPHWNPPVYFIKVQKINLAYFISLRKQKYTLRNFSRYSFIF